MTVRDDCLIPEVRYSADWCRVDLSKVPSIVVEPPGPESRRLHESATRFYKGLSGQVGCSPSPGTAATGRCWRTWTATGIWTSPAAST